MAIWHPTIEAHEIHSSRRENWSDKNPSVTVLLLVDAANAREFATSMVLERYTFPDTSISDFACLRASSAEVIHDKGCYTTAGFDDEVIIPNNSCYVTVTYTSDIRVT